MIVYKYEETDKAKNIYEEILDTEVANGMPEEIILHAKKKFNERIK